MAHYQDLVFDAISAVSGQKNILTIPRIFIRMTGSHKRALALSQIIYWSDRGRDREWFYKSFRGWEEELGIPVRSMQRVIDDLREMGLVETDIRRVSGAPTNYYRLCRDKLVELFIEHSESAKVAETESAKVAETITP